MSDDMSDIQVSIDIDRPVGDVWDQVSQLEDHARWMGDVESISFPGGQKTGVGTTMHVLTRVGPFTTNDVIVVEEWNAPDSIAVTHRGIVSGSGVFRLESMGATTRFTWSERLSFPWYLGGGITAFAARPVLKHIWRANLRRFAETLT
ncbi:MAG: SRPBCC family protein [Acidimicrobiia bacterium]